MKPEWKRHEEHDRAYVDAICEHHGIAPPEHPKKPPQWVWQKFDGRKFWPIFNAKGHNTCAFDTCACRFPQGGLMDYSTLNHTELKKLKTYVLPPTYRLSGFGSGCFGDPPGYPSYFIQHVYTRCGSAPRTGLPQLGITLDGVFHVLPEVWEDRVVLLRKLWSPLPVDHPRTRLWIRDSYRHSAHCYLGADGSTAQNILIWPICGWQLTSAGILEPNVPRELAAHPDLAQTWLARETVNYMARKREFTEAARRLCIPERHLAVARIQKFYPGYQPEIDLIENPPDTREDGDWWETETERPEPDQCTPRNSLGGGGSYDWRHPKEPGRCCQWCGRTNPTKEMP